MTVTYRPAAAVARIAKDLIGKHHHELDDVRIEYAFRSETAKSRGKEIWGQARKISGLNAYLSQEEEITEAESGDVDYFVIEISEPVWAELDAGQRKALVDHELCHCTTEHNEDTGDLTLKLRHHDVEEFAVVVKRHGIWRPDLAAFSSALPERQRTIDDSLTDADDPAGEFTVSVNGGPEVPLEEGVDQAARALAGVDAP
jgi:hypothetical protein